MSFVPSPLVLMSVREALIVCCVCPWHSVNGGDSPFVNLASNVKCCFRYLHYAAPARRACSPATPGDFFLDWYPALSSVLWFPFGR